MLYYVHGYPFAEGKHLMMKYLYVWLILLLFCGGCSVDQGAFGAKFCAAYRNYDSAAFHLQKYLAEQKNDSPHLQMFLGVAEMYRGNLPEMHAAFEKAEQTGTLLRCNWYIENGEPEKAAADLARLKTMLAGDVVPENYGSYYCFLVIRDALSLSRDPAEKQNLLQILRQGADLLEKKLAELNRTPGDGLFALRRIGDPALAKITFGMTDDELCGLLGKPYKNIFIGGMQKRRILIWHRNGSLIGFFFTEKSPRLGEVKTATVCKKHGVKKMRLLERGKTLFGSLQKPFYDEDFRYTAEYADPVDFQWSCLDCSL